MSARGGHTCLRIFDLTSSAAIRACLYTPNQSARLNPWLYNKCPSRAHTHPTTAAARPRHRTPSSPASMPSVSSRSVPLYSTFPSFISAQASRTTFQTFGSEHDLRRASRTSRSTLGLDDFLSFSPETSLSHLDSAPDSDHDSLISTTDDDTDSLISLPRSCGDRTAIHRQASSSSLTDDASRVLIANLESIIADLSSLNTALHTELSNTRHTAARLAIELDVARQRQALYKQQAKMHRQEIAGVKAKLRSQAGSRVYPKGTHHHRSSDSDRGERATLRMSKGSELKILLTVNDSTPSTPQRPTSLVLSADISNGLAPPTSAQPSTASTPKGVKRLSRTAKNAFAHFARTPAIPANWHEPPPDANDSTPRPSTAGYRSQTSSAGAMDTASIISIKTAKPAKQVREPFYTLALSRI